MPSLLDAEQFIPLQQKVAEYGIRYFVETDARGDSRATEAAMKLGLRVHVRDPIDYVAISAKHPQADVYDGDIESFLQFILPRLHGPALFYLDPDSDSYETERRMIEAASTEYDWFFEEKPSAQRPALRVVADNASGIEVVCAPSCVPAPVGDHSPEFDRHWMGPPSMKPRVYRSQTEKDIWMSICVENEYKLTALQPDDLVVDIGAHIGAFSWLAHFYGSRNIKAFEIDPWHIEGAQANLEGLPVEIFHAAVVRGDGKRLPEYRYTRGAWTASESGEEVVPSVSLDEIIDRFGPITFLKIDCEGDEWSILYTCKQLHKIAHIAGEWHSGLKRAGMDYLPAMTPEDLSRFLREAGFNETRFSAATETNGNFWAHRWI